MGVARIILLTPLLVGAAEQRYSSAPHPLEFDPFSSDDTFKFAHPIRRVAVIGAGHSGLQCAVALIEHGMEVRLFDRSQNPGGNWQYSELLPIPANFENKPIEFSAYTPDIPPILPMTNILEDLDSDDQVTNEWRLREHWNPSPVLTTLPGLKYLEDTEWRIPRLAIQRHVQQYASLHGLNSNDDDHLDTISYSTRVERIEKPLNASAWTLTLKRMVEIPYYSNSTIKRTSELRADWWTEDFDAVVVATNTADSAYVPSIPGLKQWAHAYPDQIYHSRNYRTPERLAGKNVLIVGASISAAEVSRNIAPNVANFSISLRHHNTIPDVFRRKSFHRLPANMTHIAEIPKAPIRDQGIRHLAIQLVDGTNVTGFDEVHPRTSPLACLKWIP